MNILLITPHYPPQKTSTSVQMYDLSVELKRIGHKVVIVVPTFGLQKNFQVDDVQGISVFRFKSTLSEDSSNYVKRALIEFSWCFKAISGFILKKFPKVKLDLIIWWSPSIFFGGLVWYLRLCNKCKTYLILRDHFPEWAHDLGLIRKNIVYYILKIISAIQYSAAHTIGVQTQSNMKYMLVWDKYLNKRVEVLNNWQTIRKDVGCSINLSSLTLANKKVLAYTGNVGIAQGADIFIDLAKILRSKTEVVFLFVGRGSYFKELKKRAKREKLDNVIFFDQVDPREIPGLLAQCFLGLISLDDRHKSHNIPGKFVTYLNAGIPVLAKVNLDTDLMKIIKEKGVGAAFSDNKPEILAKFVIKILHDNKSYIEMTKRAKILGKEMFSVEKAAIQITKNLTS